VSERTEANAIGAPRHVSISVVVPAYNEARWIGETLESVLDQTSPPDEIIVVDDGSTDDTIAEVERFGDAVRLVRQANAGCAAAFNRGFAETSAEFVALCPADDLWEPRRLEWQREILARNPDVDVVFGRARYFGMSDDEYPQPVQTGVQERREFTRLMFDHNVIPDPAAVVRRSLHERLGGYRHVIGEDYEFWLRALAAGARFYYDPRLVVRLRLHGGNLSSRALEIWETLYAARKEHAQEVDDELARRTLARNLLRIGRCALGVAQTARAREAYGESLRYRFSLPALAGRTALSVPGADSLVRTLVSRRASGGAAPR
jgi:glycosyltransferase involved in cell wall biosynthesis